MLDERSFARSSDSALPADARAAPATSRDWVAEFRREQAHFVRVAPRYEPARALSYGAFATLAVLLTVLAIRLPGPVGWSENAPSSSPAPHPAATELAEAREEALTYDLARARQEAEATRRAHLLEAEALRAAVARFEAGSSALARDLDDARTALAAARQAAAEARAAGAADAEAREREADARAALARALHERDEARARLATALAAQAPDIAAAPDAAPQPMD